MPHIKLTSKRQATFPQGACDALRVGPGDIIQMEPGIVDGQNVYILQKCLSGLGLVSCGTWQDP